MTARHHDLDPRRLFWGILDGSLVSRDAGVPRHQQLEALFESKLPVPLESVHCRFVGAPEGRVVAIAALHEDLDAIQAASPWVTSAAPESWPPPVIDSLGTESLPPASSINLLTGLHEPIAVRRVRRHAGGWAAAAVVAIAGLILLGGEWRRAATLEQRASISMAKEQVLDRVLPPQRVSTTNPQPQELRLQIALRELARTRETASRGGATPSRAGAPPAEVLSTVLASWPPEREIRLQSLDVNGLRVSMSVETTDAETLQALLVRLDSIELLRAEPLQGGPRASGYGGTLALRVSPPSPEPVTGGSP